MSERFDQLSQYQIQFLMPVFDLTFLANTMRWGMLLLIITGLVWLMTVIFPKQVELSTDESRMARTKE
jgi:hypothetical protein